MWRGFVIEFGLAHGSRAYLQSGCDRRPGDSVRGLPVGGQGDAGGVRVGTLHSFTVARLEGEQEMTTRREHPLEFGEYLVEVLRA